MGHWESNCPVGGRGGMRGGRVQMVGRTEFFVSQKLVASHMQGPPPILCQFCGDPPWEHFCRTSGQGALLGGGGQCKHGPTWPACPSSRRNLQQHSRGSKREGWSTHQDNRTTVPVTPLWPKVNTAAHGVHVQGFGSTPRSATGRCKGGGPQAHCTCIGSRRW